MAAISPATIEEAYQHYVNSKQPSYAVTADVYGVSLRLVQEWATAGQWQERYRTDQERLVATIRHNAERELDTLLPRALVTLGDMLDARSETVRLDAAKHILGLRGLTVTHRQQSVSLVQHVRSSVDAQASGVDVLDVFRDRVAALVGMPSPLPPGDYREEREVEDGRVPTTHTGDVAEITMSEHDASRYAVLDGSVEPDGVFDDGDVE
jgi:hypothetical protein